MENQAHIAHTLVAVRSRNLQLARFQPSSSGGGGGGGGAGDSVNDSTTNVANLLSGAANASGPPPSPGGITTFSNQHPVAAGANATATGVPGGGAVGSGVSSHVGVPQKPSFLDSLPEYKHDPPRSPPHILLHYSTFKVSRDGVV